MAAPTATTSSGFTPLCGSLPVSSRTRSTTAGMRVEPPTRMMWSIWSLLRPASRIACSNGPRHAARREGVGGHLLELRARELELEVQRPVARRRDERQVDRGLLRGGELDLG